MNLQGWLTIIVSFITICGLLVRLGMLGQSILDRLSQIEKNMHKMDDMDVKLEAMGARISRLEVRA